MPFSTGQMTHNLPAGIAVAGNKLEKLIGVHKFGYNATVGTSYETVWDGSNVYSDYNNSGASLLLTSTSGATDDTVKVTVEGLDSSWALTSEEFDIGPDGTASGSETFKRVFRAFVSGDQAAAGTINITNDAETETYAKILPAYQQTQMALYTIPAGHTGYITSVEAGYSKNNEFEVMVMTKSLSPLGIFRTRAILSGYAGGLERKFEYPIVCPAGTDIQIRAKAGASGAVTAAFNLFIEKN